MGTRFTDMKSALEHGFELPTNAEERAIFIMNARSQLTNQIAMATTAAKSFQEADAALSRISRARAYLAAGVAFKPVALQFTRGDQEELNTLEEHSRLAVLKARNLIDPLLRQQMRRMQMALAKSTVPAKNDAGKSLDPEARIDLAEEQLNPDDRIRDALRVLSLSSDHVERLRSRFAELNALLPRVRPEGNSASLVQQVRFASKRANDALREVHLILLTASYPYEHTQDRATISLFCCPKLPAANQIRAIHVAAKVTLSGVYGLYFRILSELAERAEQAEKAIGLLPLDEPATLPPRKEGN
jgi:hypothetical protein